MERQANDLELCAEESNHSACSTEHSIHGSLIYGSLKSATMDGSMAGVCGNPLRRRRPSQGGRFTWLFGLLFSLSCFLQLLPTAVAQVRVPASQDQLTLYQVVYLIVKEKADTGHQDIGAAALGFRKADAAESLAPRFSEQATKKQMA